MNIIGISAYYHDSAVALVCDGNIVAAAQEERFTRKKHDASFPKNALNYCLQAGKIDLKAVDYVVFYDKPLVKFERLLETYLAYAPRGFRSFLQAMPVWLKEKLYLKTVLQKELKAFANSKTTPPLLFTEHHQSHAAAAYFPSPFDKAAVMCLDGVGEWATTSVWLGENNTLTPQWEIDFPHSLGLLYSAFTYFTGFKVNSGEYKLMGLAPYGEPKYVQTILDNLVDVKPDGTFRLNMCYFNYPVGLTMTNSAFADLFDGAARQSESEITQREMDIASSIQVVTEDIVLKLARTVRKELDVNNLCLAGGVALNCVANGKLLKEQVFDNIWIQPAAGDAGGALGAALTTWYEYLDNPRQTSQNDAMQGGYLGTKFSNDEIKAYLDSVNAEYTYLPDAELMPQAADLLAQEKVIGWFQGRMEFGPRALGVRSILGDPRSEKMQSVMNLKIKYRESFRPFAPSILAERVSDYFDINDSSPYMLLVANIKPEYRIPMTDEQQQLFGIEKLNIPRSQLPAITHLDYSARIQTVHQETNPRYHQLLTAFDKLTGCPVLVNTSFNVRGEPIVHTPQQAYQCFMRTEMDYLILENYLLEKSKQPAWQENHHWQQEFELD
ncbi:carbamoyltransferase [Candidatus Albibeggiatoa sp. nov. NOAA]|uniref:carbamoyltransferase family protein n=1 Tax=Candidatus Albibeggiatoa sp. nov. NOAA TaxID=3162724 RepID=UPI0033015AB9|nr:carbamoyltransferase [Thiotrichaceae bacterium]